jgi:signal transduction histidine kinase/HAMP domain-containing protein
MTTRPEFFARFTTRLSAAILLIAVLPAIIVGYMGVRQAQENLKSAAQERYIAAAARVQDQIALSLESASTLALTATALLKNANIEERSAFASLREMLSYNQRIGVLGIYDAQGNAVEILSHGENVALPPVLDAEYRARIQALAETSETIVDKPQKLSARAALSAPVCAVWKSRANSKIIGYVLTAVEQSRLRSLVAALSAQMFSGLDDRIFLVSAEGRLIAHADSALAARQKSMRNVGIFSAVSLQGSLRGSLRETAPEMFAAVQEYRNSDGEDMLGTILALPQIQSYVVVEEPQSVAYRNLEILRRSALAASVLCACAAAVLALVFVRRFSRPIEALSAAAAALRTQDFSPKLSITRSDEFGALFATMNDVARELGKYQALNIRQIIAERNKLETVVRQATDGLAVFEPNGEVRLVNPVFCAWFGVHHDVEGLSFAALSAQSESLERVREAFRALQNGEETVAPFQCEIKKPTEARAQIIRGSMIKILRSADGNEYGFAAAPADKPHTTEVLAYLLIARDITREMEIDAMKTELVAVVAHELRSPLNSINGLAELIAEGFLDRAETTEYGKTIAAQSRKLAGIITKFLDLNRLESGKTEIRRVRVRLDEILRSAITAFQALARQKSIALEMRFPSESAFIVGDPDLLGMALGNLVGNAIKYSPPQTTVAISLEREAASALVKVADEGFGISESSQAKIFTKFFRAADDKRVQNETGTGLGLAFAKEIVERHNGEIGVQSVLGKGSTFFARFPLPES